MQLYPKHYSLYSKIDRFKLHTFYNLDWIKEGKEALQIIVSNEETNGLKFAFSEIDQVEYFNYVPFDIFKEIVLNLSEIYTKQYPQGDIATFIDECFGTMKFECEKLLEIFETNIQYWLTLEKYDCYSYLRPSGDIRLLIWASKSQNDIHFYKTYLAAILKFLNGGINSTEALLLANNSIMETPQETSLQWKGTQVELLELGKALILNGNLDGKQSDILRKLSIIFNLEIKNPDQSLQNIKNRNIGGETIFLDKLRDALNKYITKPK